MTRAKAEAAERAWIESAIRSLTTPSKDEQEEREFKHAQRTRLAVFRATVLS